MPSSISAIPSQLLRNVNRGADEDAMAILAGSTEPLVPRAQRQSDKTLLTDDETATVVAMLTGGHKLVVVAKALGLSPLRLRRFLLLRGYAHPKTRRPTRDELERDGMTMTLGELADRYDVNASTIVRWRKDYRIKEYLGRHKHVRLSAAQKAEVVEDFLVGAKMNELSSKWGQHCDSLRWHIMGTLVRRRRWPRANETPITGRYGDIDAIEVVRMWAYGADLGDIADACGKDALEVAEWLRLRGWWLKDG